MKIIAIYKPYIYSIKYEGRDSDEFHRLFEEWNDVSYLVSFFKENRKCLKADCWANIKNPLEAAQNVIEESESLEDLFYELFKNTKNNKLPDFDSHFKYLEGKYKYEIKYIPMKSYGTNKPSLLRIYAIRLSNNTYVITGGGIKLAKTIQDSPDIKEYVLQNIERVKQFLISLGVCDSTDLETL